MPSERFVFVLQQSDDAVMRPNLIARFAVHTRFRRIMYGCHNAGAEQKRSASALKFNSAWRLSFAFYTTSPKSGFYAAKFKRIRAAFMFKFTLRFAIFGANKLQNFKTRAAR